MERKFIQDEDGTIYIEIREGESLPKSKEQLDGFRKQLENKEVYNNSLEQYGEFYFKERKCHKKFSIDTSDSSDLARLIYALTFMSFDRVLKTDNGAYINKSMLFKTMKVDRKIFNKWFDRMISENIFMYIDDTYISVVSEEYIKGNLPQVKNNQYTKLYNDTIREIYSQNIGKNMNAMGLIFKMIPYMHKDANMICANPKCKDVDSIKHITVGQIAKEFGYNDNIIKMEKMLSKFVLSNGEPIVLFLSNGNRYEDRVLINPIVMFGGNSKDLPQIHQLFRSYAVAQGKLNG